MSEQAIRLMAADEFLEWCLVQDKRYELIDGVPVAMTGARRRHDQIVVNVTGLLFNQLRGRSCRTFTPDTAVRIPSGNVRRPDAGVDCGAFNEDETWADAPFLVIEVLSPSTQAIDLLNKLDEYKTIPSLAHVVIVDSRAPVVRHWHRAPPASWEQTIVEGLEAVIPLPELSATLDLATLYEGLTFQIAPKLVNRKDG